MTLTSYPSISRIAALAAKEGYVVGVEDGKTTVETGTEIVTFHPDRTITDSTNKVIDMEAALKQLKLKLDS